MTKSFRLAVVLALPLGAFAADPSLLQLVIPDAQVVAGLQVDSAKSSLFGQYVLSHLSVNDTKLEQFATETGFDPRHDVSEIVVASNWKQNTPDNRWIVAAHGAFNVSKITDVYKRQARAWRNEASCERELSASDDPPE